MKRAFLALALCLPAARSAGAAGFNAAARGTTTAEFLSLGAGARAVAMGQAYGAAADDATALYWNPAALTRVPRRSATLMHAAYIDSSFFDYGAYAQNLGAWGAFGTSFQYFSAGQIKQTDATGTDVGSFTPYDLAVSAGYAYRLGGIEFMPDFNGFSLGVSAKLIQSKILATAQTAAVDVGLLTPAYWNGRFRGSLTVTNLGGRMRFEETAEALPAAARLGSALALTPAWLLSADAVFPRGDGAYGALGTEYAMAASGPWKFAGRAGYSSQTAAGISGLTGVSLGFGVGRGKNAFDYAFVPFGGLGQAHRLSFTYNF